MRQRFAALFVAVAMLLALPGVAGAHAVVFPTSMNANSYEKFTLRVPVEKESATVSIKVEVPEGFLVSRVKPLAGWTYTVEKSADGKSVKAITWSGGQILPGEFQEFEFQGKTAENPGKYAFKAYQTYADGETVNWTGPSDAKTPASVVELKAAAAGTDAHGQEKAAQPAAQAPAETAPAPATTAPAAAGGANPMTTAAAYGGLALGAIALLLALRRR